VTKLITSDFEVLSTNNFIKCASEDGFYVFAARSRPFENDLVPPQINNSVQESFYDIHKSLLFAKKVTPSDIIPMIRRIDWVFGKVFDSYNQSTPDLKDKDFYVLSIEGSNYSVFKCLDNNGNRPSTQRPLLSQTSPSDELYRTGDGYVWKYMYTVQESAFKKFATTTHMPFVENEDVKDFAIEGTVERVSISEGGSGYTVSESGLISQINVGGNNRKFYIQPVVAVDTAPLNASPGYYTGSGIYMETGPAAGQFRKIVEDGFDGNNRYVIIEAPFSSLPSPTNTFDIAPFITLRGDGSGFLAKGVIENESLSGIEIINRGSGYTFAEAIVSSNTNTISGQSSEPALLNITISPKGGHGSRAQYELYGSFAGVSVDFVSDLVPAAENEYRTFGIMSDLTYSSIQLRVTNISEIATSGLIEQENTGAFGTILNKITESNLVTIINSKKEFEVGEKIVGTDSTVIEVLFDYVTIDQTLKLGVSLVFEASFSQGEKIVQEVTGAEGYIFAINENEIKVVEINGTFIQSPSFTIIGQSSGAIGVINTIKQPDSKIRSGDILYAQNILPIKRSEDQTERVKLIIGF
jgi:hypothetical protein